MKHSDVPRPLRPAVVVDTDNWADTGAAYIGVMVAGAYRQAVYRDGAEPQIGDVVYVAAMAAGHAPYLAFPLPGVLECGGVLYVSGHDVSGGAGGEWAVLTVDLATLAWARLSTSPVSGSYARRPLRACKAGFGGYQRLLAWGVTDAGGGAVGTGSDLYQSDDGGLTWGAAGLAGVRHVSYEKGYFGGLVTALYAVADDGAAIYWSPDGGESWALVQATGNWLAVEALGQSDDWVVALGTDGGYSTTCRFQPRDPIFPPALVGPYSPGSTGFGALMAEGSQGWFQRVAGDSAVRGKTASWGEEPANQGGATLSSDPGAGFAGDAAVGFYSLWAASDGAAGGLYGTQQQVGVGADMFDTLDSAWLAYRSDENHPHGLTGIGGRAIATAQGAAPSQCLALALDDDTAGNGTHARLVTMKVDDIINGSQLAGLATDASARQVADTGAEYAISHDGLANLGA